MITDSMTNEIPEKGRARQLYFIDLVSRILNEAASERGRAFTYHVTTFGCQMNARDSEKLRGILELCGYLPAPTEDADLVLFNTCTVRENANTRVYGRLGALRGMKKTKKDMRIVLCGCMTQEERVAEEIRREHRYIDLVFGTHNLHRFAELLARMLTDDEQVIAIQQERDELLEQLPVRRTYPFKSGVNITYGCDNFCSYCIVPYVRGREISRPAEDILGEVKELSADGVKEIMLLGQNVNSYGVKEESEILFPELLAKVAETGIPRIRFMTSHPKDLSDELIRVMRDYPNICRHLHLPLQSGSDRILELMNRKYTRDRYRDLVSRIREAIPDISLTTDLIVGFPGETEEDHQQTLSLVEETRFDTAFTFQYSPRAGTPASRLPGRLSPEVMRDRFDRLLEVVQRVGRKQSGRFEGQVKEVLVEERNAQEPGLVTGRMDNNLLVHFPGTEADIGQILPVRLSACRGFYYIGEKAEEREKG